MTGRWSRRETGAAIFWTAALILYAISVNTTWFILDGQEFDVPRNISSMRPLIGAGTIGSATFVFYLVAMIVLFGFAAAAIRDSVTGNIWFGIGVVALVVVATLLRDGCRADRAAAADCVGGVRHQRRRRRRGPLIGSTPPTSPSVGDRCLGGGLVPAAAG